MRIKGTITNWNDERGYGFIEPDAGGRDVFVHISAFDSSIRGSPESRRVVFEKGRDARGRTRAENVRFTKQRMRLSQLLNLDNLGIAAAVLFLGFLALAAFSERFQVTVPAFYLLASLLLFGVYAWDKSAARNDRWRTPEKTLHLLALAGGWPGALVAQKLFRHKSRKRSFQVIFWLTVVLNCAGLYLLHSKDGIELLKPLLDYLLA